MRLFHWLFGRPHKRGVVVGDGRFALRVVGTASHQERLERVIGGRSSARLRVYRAALLVPQPSNLYDRQAVAVILAGLELGHLGRGDARKFQSALCGHGFADAACEAEIIGGWLRGEHDWGYVGVRLNACLPFKIITADQYEKTQSQVARQEGHRVEAPNQDPRGRAIP